MKIAHVVTLVTPDGAFGGPARVAVNLAREQSARGDSTVLVGAYRGFKKAPNSIDGVTARLFRAYRLLPVGFSGLVSPGLYWHTLRSARTYDLVHVHLARDLITMLVAVWALVVRRPYVVQTHGMVDESSRGLARVVDILLTRRVLRNASSVLYLTDQERADLTTVSKSGAIKLTALANGVPASELRANYDYPSIVLFVARLHARKRPDLFAEAALELHSEFPQARFVMYGPDEGEGARVHDLIASRGAEGYLSLGGALEPHQTVSRMAQSGIYVLPSVNEPFPMSVLEAMSVGLPVIIGRTCGLASYVHDAHAGLIVDESLRSLVAAIRALLVNAGQRHEMGHNALRLVQSSFSMAAIVEELNHVYENALEAAKSTHA